MAMKLSEYFEQAQGTGILATADSSGYVNAAVYSRPHFLDENTIAFIMTGRMTHDNLSSNPHAAYIFIEEGPGYRGKRLFITKIKEDEDAELIDTLRRKRRSPLPDGDTKGGRYLVTFRIDKVLPLVGTGDAADDITPSS